MTEALHTKYRPTQLEHVVGQEHVTKPLARLLSRRESQAFLFMGPSGVGKTTLARICANELGCERPQEIPAARYTGVDKMREVLDTLQYTSFGKSPTRALILDESHRLTIQAWESLLIDIEKPPDHVFWFFCTTEPGKIPAAIKTRCSKFTLKLVPDSVLTELVQWVATEEGIKLVDGVLSTIVKEAKGSPRDALVNLATCATSKDRKEAAASLHAVYDDDATLALCRFVTSKNPGSWGKAMEVFKKLEEENAESVRIVVANYVGSCLKGAKSDNEACYFLRILEAFATPYNPSEGTTPLLRSVGQVLFSG